MMTFHVQNINNSDTESIDFRWVDGFQLYRLFITKMYLIKCTCCTKITKIITQDPYSIMSKEWITHFIIQQLV